MREGSLRTIVDSAREYPRTGIVLRLGMVKTWQSWCLPGMVLVMACGSASHPPTDAWLAGESDGSGPEAGSPDTEPGGAFGAPCTQGVSYAENCIASCARNSDWTSVLECIDGRWQCPMNGVPKSQCPVGSCGTTSRSCCDPVTGEVAPAECSQGLRSPCPVGTDEIQTLVCKPESLSVEECRGLGGTACEAPQKECHWLLTTCECKNGEWECRTLLI